jgi:hypothetical protein
MLVRSLLPLAVLGFGPILAVAELDYRRRDFRTLTNRQVEGIAKLDPPEWESVTSGHLENLLIPRVCECGIDCVGCGTRVAERRC